MNRSILIVICDFLLLSLLAFSTVDLDKSADPQADRRLQVSAPTNPPDRSQDLTAVMKVALEEERKNREQLAGELNQTRAALDIRDQEVKSIGQRLQSREQEAMLLKREQSDIQKQFASAQTTLSAIRGQLEKSSTDAAVSKEKLAGLEKDLNRRVEEAAMLKQRLDQLSSSNQVAAAEQQRLNTQLQIAEVERRAAADQLSLLRDTVQAERTEKIKLADGFKALATESDKLTREMRENRALAPNTIFSEFLTNRVEARFHGFRAAFLGIDSTRDRNTGTILVTDGASVFALCHVQDTPFSLQNPGVDWENLNGTLRHGRTEVSIQNLALGQQDPRVVLIPVSDTDAQSLGTKIYTVARDPFKFQDGVLVGAGQGYYGQCKFEIDETTPNYLKLDRRFLKGLFGEFNPSRGDLLFSRTGELLGIMANNSYCQLIRQFNPGVTFRFGTDVKAQHTSETLAQLSSALAGLPFKLQ